MKSQVRFCSHSKTTTTKHKHKMASCGLCSVLQVSRNPEIPVIDLKRCTTLSLGSQDCAPISQTVCAF